MKFSHNIGAKIKSRFMFLLSIIERTMFYVMNFVIFSGESEARFSSCTFFQRDTDFSFEREIWR